MELQTNVINFSQYEDGDLVHAVIAQSKTYENFMAPQLRRLKPSANLNNVCGVISSIAIAGEAYTYLTSRVKRITALYTHEVTTHTLAVGGEIRPIGNLKVPIVTKDGLNVADVSTVVDGAEVDDLLKIEEYTCNVKAPVNGPGIAISYNGAVYCGPLVNGDPIFDSLGTKFLTEAGVEATVIRSREVIVGHVIVDLVRLSGGQFQPKKVPVKLGVFSKEDLALIDKFMIEIVKVFGSYVKNAGSQKGRVLLKTIFSAMVASRSHPQYDQFIKQFADWATMKRSAFLPKKLGEYNGMDLDYAKTILSYTRGVRGGDDSDSTSLGLSTYLDFNVDRGIVKCLARAKDVMRVLALTNAAKDQISFVGKGALAYVESLLMVNIKIKQIGTPKIPQGWAYDSKSKHYFHQHHSITLVMDTVGLVFNTDLLGLEAELSEHRAFSWVQAIECPVDYRNGRYVPSCLVHNLTGWLLPVQYKMAKKVIEVNVHKDYLTLANIVNVTRMYPSLFPNDRAVTILRRAKYPVIDFSLYTRLVAAARVDGFVTLFTSHAVGADFGLLDLLDSQQVATIVAAVKQKVVDAAAAPDDEFQAVTLGGEVDDDPGLEKSKTKNKPLTLDSDDTENY